MKRGYLLNSSLESYMCHHTSEIYVAHCKNSSRLNSDEDGVISIM